MTTSEDSAMTPAQAANFKILRRVVFGAAVVISSVLLWHEMQPGGQISIALHRSSLSRLDGTGRASVLALSVLAGLVFAWFASTNIAKILARQVR
jgi:hypothetical protein